MSLTPKQGINTCIQKEDRSKHLLKNSRPISLLKTAHKIASASIAANRLKLMLQNIIHSGLKGFRKGRYIEKCIKLLYNILLYTDTETEQKIQDSYLWWIFKNRSTAFLGHLFKKLWNFPNLV